MAEQNHMAVQAAGCEDAMGSLPTCAPLANPYVPFQNSNPQRYAAGRALAKGTIFPGLDLPYRGQSNVEPREAGYLRDLQAVNFAVTELGLYLDTHADDSEAVQLFNQYVEQLEMLRQQAEQSGIALQQTQAAAGGKYTWLDDPWPWDAETEE